MDKSKALLKKVSDVLDDDERMDALNKIGKEEINEYIEFQWTVLFLENLSKEKEAKNITEFKFRKF